MRKNLYNSERIKKKGELKMRKYLLDTNIIIKLWNENSMFLEKLIEGNKVVILKEVLEELSIKEKRIYRRKEVLSERFCKLLPCGIEVKDSDISGFFMIYDYETKGKFENNNLSRNDLLQICACYTDESLTLITEDKELFNIGKYILQENRVKGILDIEL